MFLVINSLRQQLMFVMVTGCVVFQERTEFLNTIKISALKGLMERDSRNIGDPNVKIDMAYIPFMLTASNECNCDLINECLFEATSFCR
jgi:hypothetical protein